MRRMPRRITIFVLMLALLMTFCGSPVFADSIDDITFDSGTMFSVGLGNSQTFQYVLKGLSGSSKVTIPDPSNISWTSSNPSLASLSSSTGDTVTITTASSGSGSVVITAYYGAMSVHSDVLVANGYVYDDADNITAKLTISGSAIFTKPLAKVNNFSLKTVFGTGFNDSGVKKDKVTALHALLYALEEHYDAGGVADGWDWVPSNVVITYNGAYVYSISSYANNWTYKIQTTPSGTWVMPGVAASQYVMNDNYQMEWRFGAW